MSFYLKSCWVLSPAFISKMNSGCPSSLSWISGMCWHDCPSAPCWAGRALIWWQSDVYSDSFRILWSDPNEMPSLLMTLQVVIPLFLTTSFFTVSPFSSVSLTSDVLSVQHLQQRLHRCWTWKLVFFPLSALQCLKFPYHFFLRLNKMCCRHTVVPILLVSRYTKIANGTAHACP